MRHHCREMGAGHWVAMGVTFVVVAVLGALVVGFAAMYLWNWLMPAIFGLKTIGYWQAFGLLLLSWLLFGRFRGGHHWHGRRWRRRMLERWERMSPEERERSLERIRSGWGYHHDHHEPPASGNTT